MEVILIRDVDKLGKSGEVIKVSEGYARNFLVPRGMAVSSSPKNLKKIEREKELKEIHSQKERKSAQELAEKMKGVSCTVAVETNENDKLYGSVTQLDIAKALEAEGFKVDEQDIIMEKPIEELGIFDIEVKLHPQVQTKIKLWVTKR